MAGATIRHGSIPVDGVPPPPEPERDLTKHAPTPRKATASSQAVAIHIDPAGVELESITKAYIRNQPVVRDVSLRVEPGEFLALLGPSGAGKTTILRLIAGFLEPDSGNIRIGGRSLIGTPPHKRNLGIAFQNYALFPHLTVAENIAFPLKMRRVSRHERRLRVADVLNLVSLTGFEDRKPNELSGGQQQRVALARAIVYDPQLLLMDEPIAALDKQLREEVRSEIRMLQKRLGITVIYVTHDQDEALSLADRVAVMSQGVIEQVATPREVYRNPSTPFVASFVGEGNFLPARLKSVSGEMATVTLRDGHEVAGQLTMEGRTTTKRGSAVTYMVRPEHLRFVASEVDADNTLTGVVKEVFYYGQSVKCMVDSGNDELEVVVPLTDVSENFPPPSSHCTVGWPTTAARILPAAEGEVDKRSKSTTKL